MLSRLSLGHKVTNNFEVYIYCKSNAPDQIEQHRPFHTKLPGIILRFSENKDGGMGWELWFLSANTYYVINKRVYFEVSKAIIFKSILYLLT